MTTITIKLTRAEAIDLEDAVRGEYNRIDSRHPDYRANLASVLEKLLVSTTRRNVIPEGSKYERR